MKKDFDLTRLFGLCGILAPVISLSCIFIAISYLPWFSWTENYLSDIGGYPGSDCLWSTWGIASVIFNFGLMASGTFGFIFALGLKQSNMFNSKSGNLGTVLLMLDAFALIGIGLFTESTGDWHILFTLLFFILSGLAVGVLGISQLKSHETKFGLLTIALLIFGLCALPLFMTPQPLGSNAIAEIIPIISFSIFCMVYGYKLYNSKSDL